MKQTIRFSKNWNRKLNGEFFTTFRLPSEKYTPDSTLRVECNDTYIYDAKVLHTKEVKLKDLTEYDTLPDAGLCRLDFMLMMKTMYPSYDFAEKPVIKVLLQCIGYDHGVVGQPKPRAADPTVGDVPRKIYVQPTLNLV